MSMSSLRQPRRLDELLNYRLQRLHAISGAPVIRLLEGHFGVTRREWRLLATLAHRGATSPSDLALELHLDRTRTSRAIGALLEKGLLQRQTLPGDGRRAEVQLTEAGNHLVDAAFPQIAAINAQVVAALDDHALEQLDQALQRLTQRALAVNQSQVLDAKADRRAGGSRRVRMAGSDEA